MWPYGPIYPLIGNDRIAALNVGASGIGYFRNGRGGLEHRCEWMGLRMYVTVHE